MDRYHSIVGPMVSYHWKPLKTIVSNGCQTTKPLKNHWYQWFLDQKPLEKKLLPMFFGPKTIVKPLLPMVLETKNHHTTIDINGGFPTIYSMAMVSMKTFKCFNVGNHKDNIELKWFPRDTFVTLGWVSLSKVFLPLCFCSTNHVFLRFGIFCEPAFNHWKTIDVNGESQTIDAMAMVWL